MEKIVLYNGSKIQFNNFLDDEDIDSYLPFMELIRRYNYKVRASDVLATSEIDVEKEEIKNVIIYADDFSSVTEHVITNFTNIVLLGFDITNLYIQNAPKRVCDSLSAEFSDIIVKVKSDYFQPDTQQITDFYELLLSDRNVIGQKIAKKKSCIGLFKSSYPYQNQKNIKRRPVVLLYYGPSGVGKTELAKAISKLYRGKLTRIQFSMMQTEEAYKYIFGDEHSHSSLARDLLARDSNVVLIDEFDKVSPGLYNVFYQMFDEGSYEDTNYSVDVSNCIFILTSNFLNEQNIVDSIGLPVYSRIDQKIKFQPLTSKELEIVVKSKFDSLLSNLQIEDQDIINNSSLEQEYLNHIDTFKNIRMLDKFIDNDVFGYLMDKISKGE